MKKLILSFTTYLCIGSFSAQVDSVFYYNPDGTKNWWYIQNDVQCIRCLNGLEYTAAPVNSAVINSRDYEIDNNNLNLQKFNAGTTIAERNAEKTYARQHPTFEYESLVLTKDKFSVNDFTKKRFVKTNDEILVIFKNPNISISQVNQFTTDYNLILAHKPSSSLPSTTRWTYIFRLKNKTTTNTLEVAKIIGSDNRIYSAEPNLIGGKPHDCPNYNETINQVQGYNFNWHISNDDGVIIPTITDVPVNDADADICECWGEGFTGAGIKIGVMDFYGINFNHEDMQSVFVPGVKVTGPSSFVPLNSDEVLDPIQSHLMQVSGMIAANVNNSSSMTSKAAIGIAYGSSISPILLPNNFTTGDVIMGLQKAYELNIDVLNMSFETTYEFGLYNELNNLAVVGRGGKGIVMIASTGNDNQNFFGVWPASSESTIGVGGSNPSDQRMSYDSPASWSMNTNQGSNFGPPNFNYHVVAPAELLVSADMMGSNGNELGNYSLESGTSFAAPIVSGISALLLEKNPNLNWTQVRDILTSSADKVNPSLYNYNQFSGFAGYNEQMFYGRVNCMNAITSPIVSVKGIDLSNDILLSQDENSFKLTFQKDLIPSDFKVVVFDMTGKIISLNQETNSNQIYFNSSSLSSGMYIINIFNSSSQVSLKVIK
ncbi:MAG: hypothetical protein RL264_2292 [Bacteroidota bacterium]|jgi:subtilisin family serine protease